MSTKNTPRTRTVMGHLKPRTYYVQNTQGKFVHLYESPTDYMLCWATTFAAKHTIAEANQVVLELNAKHGAKTFKRVKA